MRIHAKMTLNVKIVFFIMNKRRGIDIFIHENEVVLSLQTRLWKTNEIRISHLICKCNKSECLFQFESSCRLNLFPDSE